MIKAFISHSSKQKAFALELVDRIGRDNCIIDCYDFRPAYKTLDEIFEKIETCTVFVLLLSHDSLNSEWVNREIAIAIKKFMPEMRNRFWPYIIDPDLSINDCPDWMKNDECFNLKFFKSAELLRRDIEQKFRQILWSNNANLMHRETNLIGRHEELNQFEELRYSENGRYVRSLIVSGRPGVGRKSFARKCLIELGKPKEIEPCRVSLDVKSNVEDFIVQLNLIAAEYDKTSLMRVLAGTAEEKVRVAVKLLNTLYASQSVIFIDDNMSCVLPNRYLSEWLVSVVEHNELNNQLGLFVLSRISPNSYESVRHPSIAHIALLPLTKKDRKKIFYSLLDSYNIQGVQERDVEFFVDKLLLSPSQLLNAVDAINRVGVRMAKNDIGRLIESGDKRAKPLIDYFRKNEIAFQTIIILAKFEFLDYDILEEIFIDQKREFYDAVKEMMVYGIVSDFGYSGEQLRLDHYICDYIDRNRISLPNDLSDYVVEVIENRIASSNITQDVSLYFYDLKQKILNGRISSEGFLVPSVIIKAVIDAYNKRKYDLVITICEKVLNDCHNYYDEVNRELVYWLCLSLCRTIKKNKKNADRFWTLVGNFYGSEKEFLLGFYYRHAERYHEAEKHFRSAIDQSPGMDKAKRELVTVLMEEEKYDDALKWAEENYENSNKENTYHIYAFFRCLVRKDKLDTTEKDKLVSLMNEVKSGDSLQKDEIYAAMDIDYTNYILHLPESEMKELSKEYEHEFPDSLNVKRAIRDYKKSYYPGLF